MGVIHNLEKTDDPLQLKYSSQVQYYHDVQKWLDMHIYAHYRSMWKNEASDPLAMYRELVITEEEVSRLLLGHADFPEDENVRTEILMVKENIRKLENHIQLKLKASTDAGFYHPIAILSRAFGLEETEVKLIWIGLAVELNRKYERLFGFLHDDMKSCFPTIDLALRFLFDSFEEKVTAQRSYFYLDKPLLKHALIKDNSSGHGSLLAKQLVLDERIVRYLLEDIPKVDSCLQDEAAVYFPEHTVPPLIIDQGIQSKLHAYVQGLDQDNILKENLIFLIWGRKGSGKKLQVRHFCQSYKLALFVIDLKNEANAELFEVQLEKMIREAKLLQSVLCFRNFDSLLGVDDVFVKKRTAFFRKFRSFRGPVFLLSQIEWNPQERNSSHPIINIEIPLLKIMERKLVWEAFSKLHSTDLVDDWMELAGKFQFNTGQIENAFITAKHLSIDPSNQSGLSHSSALHQACQLQVHHQLKKLGVRLKPNYAWEDIILPDEQVAQLQMACNQMKYRNIVYDQWGFARKLSYGKGLSMLFTGPPGTGKTMSAEVVANDLSMEIYKIDLSRIVSKYIGETEKNLDELFREAQDSHTILFFDEADALFGKRSEVKDSHDKHANMETAYLLQKMEEYEGVTILATNYLQNMDDAFLRRIHYIIKFPFPDAKQREQLWRSIFPKEMPISLNINYEFLAEKFKLAGGNIKNIAVASAFFAAEEMDPTREVGMNHIIRAAKHELQKTGKVLFKDELEEYG